ncbi:hypothetical protein DSO57_1018294 [Entomophthora muscae]|uniref:Uncharacterized protein n=1 Tax=Entomophthora muscae TaxID=34485 RepID=A0ACC2UDU8_9FUNG|nr:hypothetical protein DSO57_1018294 [Entomophthora muscae]
MTPWCSYLPNYLTSTQIPPGPNISPLLFRINCGTGFSPSALAFGTPNELAGIEQRNLWSSVPTCNIEQEWIKGATKHLKARYSLGNPVFALNPNSTKLEPNHTGPFKIASVYNNHSYQLEDAQLNPKTLHHDCLHPCCAIPTQSLFVCTFSNLPQFPILVPDNKQGAREVLQPRFSLPANVSYNTQGALEELLHDMSKSMDQSDNNNDIGVLFLTVNIVRAQNDLDNQLFFLEAKLLQLGNPYQLSPRARKSPFQLKNGPGFESAHKP